MKLSKQILSAGIVFIMLCGCATFNGLNSLSSVDKAKVVAEQLTSWYEKTGADVITTYKTAGPTEKEFLKNNLMPSLLKFGDILNTYDDAVKIWQETKNKPANIDEIVKSLKDLKDDIIESLSRTKEK